jgi:hypothetical protein
MKKGVLLMMVALFLFGCGTAAQDSEFLKHKSHYKNFDHLKFSWTGWRAPKEKDVEKSDGQKWWGKPIDVPKQ